MARTLSDEDVQAIADAVWGAQFPSPVAAGKTYPASQYVVMADVYAGRAATALGDVESTDNRDYFNVVMQTAILKAYLEEIAAKLGVTLSFPEQPAPAPVAGEQS